MNKIDNKQENNAALAISDIGFRFLLFRKAIGKTESQLAKALHTTVKEIDEIENGTIFPNITYLHYLNKRHHLNINWLLTKNGHMFVKKKTGKVAQRKKIQNAIYGELLELIQVPKMEMIINASLLEIKALLELEKRDYEAERAQENMDEKVDK